MQCSVLDPNIVYVSTSTLLETQGTVILKEISNHTYEMIEKIAVGVIDIVDPPRLGFQLTLRLHLDNIPRGKGKLLYIKLNIKYFVIRLKTKKGSNQYMYTSDL